MKYQKGLTLYELLIALIIASILALFGNALYSGAQVDCRNPDQRPGIIARVNESAEISKLGKLHLKFQTFWLNHSRLPDTLDEMVGRYGIDQSDIYDQWGNKYHYRQTWNEKDNGQVRKYKSVIPVNTDFDLYSAGPDGRTATPMTSTPGCDDIVRANNGYYFGYAYRYYTHVNKGK